jgi:hypothetical protein
LVAVVSLVLESWFSADSAVFWCFEGIEAFVRSG